MSNKDKADNINFKPTLVDKFGKEHWSLFGYVETCCVDSNDSTGRINAAKMSGNHHRHRILAFNNLWKDEYSTRLRGFFNFKDKHDVQKSHDAGFLLKGHDDWDCLEDLESAGLIEIISLTNGMIKMTDLGCKIAGDLRTFKAKGGNYADFVIDKQVKDYDIVNSSVDIEHPSTSKMSM